MLQQVAQVFDNCQRSAVGLRKNSATLRKLMVKAAKNDFQVFYTAFVHCVNCILAVKKKEPVVDKSIKFIASFIAHLQDQGNKQRGVWFFSDMRCR